jgi:transcriptional regulator with XRE-family HTH domain
MGDLRAARRLKTGKSSLSAAVVHRLVERRMSAGVSLPLLAKRAGLSSSALRAIEDGRAPLSLGTLSDLAEQLGTSVGHLLREARQPVMALEDALALRGSADIGRAIVELPQGVDKLEVAEAAAIHYALDVCDGNQSRAARLLGVGRLAFARRLRRFSRRGVGRPSR